MRKKLLVGCLALLLLSASFLPVNKARAEGELREPVVTACYSAKMAQLQSAMQRLWMDHVLWTRSFIVSAISGLEDEQVVLARLLKNQQDIGDAIKPFYGEKAGNQLAELLKEHILLAGKVIGAVKSGQTADAAKFDKEWHRNADDIAKFLSAANPHWSQKELQSMLYTHLQYVTDMVTARVKKDWKADVTAFDKNADHMMMFADVLSKGLIQQFPEKFQ